jgi:hypothetical protein
MVLVMCSPLGADRRSATGECLFWFDWTSRLCRGDGQAMKKQ